MNGMPSDPYNLIITGVGGQGNVLASQILGRLFVDQGYMVTIGETYGVSQRGGSVNSNIRISSQAQYSPIIPRGGAHLIIALEPLEGLRILGEFGQPEVRMVVNTRPVLPQAVLSGEKEYPEITNVLDETARFCQQLWTIDATQIALDLGNPILANIVLLGAFKKSGALPIKEKAMLKTFEESLPSKSLSQNLKAYNLGKSHLEIHQPNAPESQW